MNMEAKSEAPAMAPTRPVLTPMRRRTSVSVGMISMYWHMYSPAPHDVQPGFTFHHEHQSHDAFT